MKDYTRSNHYSNELAYLETFSGLIPCKVLAVYYLKSQWNGYNPTLVCKIKITANRKAYRKGEIIDDEIAYKIIPRSKIIVRNGQYKVICNFYWISDNLKPQ